MHVCVCVCVCVHVCVHACALEEKGCSKQFINKYFFGWVHPCVAWFFHYHDSMNCMICYYITCEVIPLMVWFSVALRPQRRVGLLGMGTEWEGVKRVKGLTAETAPKRPERPWTATRTMEVLRRCPLAIAQQLVHCAIAVSTAVLDRVTKTMSVAPLLMNNLDNSKQKTSNLLSPAPPPYSWSLLGKCEGPAPPPSSKISWSFDFAWNPGEVIPLTCACLFDNYCL